MVVRGSYQCGKLAFMNGNVNLVSNKYGVGAWGCHIMLSDDGGPTMDKL